MENRDQGLQDLRGGDSSAAESAAGGTAGSGTSASTGGGGGGIDGAANKRPRTHGEEMISWRVVGGSDQNMLEVMRRAFFQDLEESAVVMLSHPPKGTRDEWIEVPLPGLGEIGIQVHRKERVKLFDTEKEGYEGTKRTIAWSVGGGLWVDLSSRKGRREKFEKGKWVGYTIFKKS